MTQTYRTDDLTRWGSGKGSNLTPAEVDINFWDIIQRLLTLEALPDAAAYIDHFEISGTSLYVHMSDSTVFGPYTLPIATFLARGEWAAATNYAVLDTFTINGGLYLAIFPHTSAATFDAGANDGAGHDYYVLMIQTPGNAIPTGGAVGQVIQKSTTTDFATTWGWKTPTDGTARQYLIQQSSTQDDAAWETPQASDISFTPPTGSVITATNVQDALEEAANSGEAVNITYTPPSGSSLTASNVQDALDELESGGGLGRRTTWIPAREMTPMITNGAASGLIETSSLNVINTMDFDATTSESVQFEIAMPKSWDRTNISFRVLWSHATTTTNFDVVWEIYSGAIAPSTSFDVSVISFVSVTDTGGVEDTLYTSAETSSVAARDNNGDPPTDGSLMIFQVYRSASNVLDTLAVDARLQGVQLFYNINVSTDD